MGRIVHYQSVITVHIFQVLVQFRDGFLRFKINVNYNTLLYVETFDTLNEHTLTSTAKNDNYCKYWD
jgi:hypothetical protein